MPGLKLTLPTVFTDTSLPQYFPDSRMNKGSLLLIDFSHPDCQLSGVPGNGSTINNIAWANAKKLIPEGVQSTLSVYIENSITDPAKGKVEVTAKKGLHGIISQTNDITSGNDFQILLPNLIKNYISANINRGFFASVWDRKTRLPLTSTTAFFGLNVYNSGNLATVFQSGNSGIGGANLGYRGSPTDLNTLGNKVFNSGFNQITGSLQTPNVSGFKFGSGWAYGGFEFNKACSQILYQIHIVDLTAAGLTYAQADALDLAAWNAAFGAGGRFENDTFTNPSTLP